MMIWKRPSGTSLVHHQSWWCASFRYSFNCNHMPTSVDIHISKDDDMKMSCKHIFAPQLVLVNCILLSFIQMQLYAHIDQYVFFKGWWHENGLQIHLCMLIADGGSPGHGMFLNNVAPGRYEHACRRFLSLPDANHNFSGLCWLVF
jgi:hypothetical protein